MSQLLPSYLLKYVFKGFFEETNYDILRPI